MKLSNTLKAKTRPLPPLSLSPTVPVPPPPFPLIYFHVAFPAAIRDTRYLGLLAGPVTA